MIDSAQLTLFIEQVITWIENNLLVIKNLVELGILVGLYIISYLLFKKLKDYISKLLARIPILNQTRERQVINSLLRPLLFTLMIWVYVLIGVVISWQPVIGNITGNLFTAWVIIKFISILLPGKFVTRLISPLIWVVAALKILNFYDRTLAILDNLSFKSGNLHLSLLLAIKGIILFAILFWVAGKANNLVVKRIEKATSFTPSIKALLNKLTKFVLFTIAFLLTLSSIGVDLRTFAFLGGAIGVGLGFGLQKIVSNFISGIIILLDRSIKPGDVIQINDIYGRVKSLYTRFVSVVTLSGKEYLIPNENFITRQVINWSYSDELVRVDVGVGVDYDSDMHLVKELLLKSLKKQKRIVDSPSPDCLIKEFGDNTVNFKLRFWIKDPHNGIENIKSDVLFNIWDLFKEHDIELAFPQRDLHLESVSEETISRIKEILDRGKPEEKESVSEVAVTGEGE